MNAHERALRLVLEALTAACVVATVLAAANGQAWWTLVLMFTAVGSYEVASWLDE